MEAAEETPNFRVAGEWLLEAFLCARDAWEQAAHLTSCACAQCACALSMHARRPAMLRAPGRSRKTTYPPLAAIVTSVSTLVSCSKQLPSSPFCVVAYAAFCSLIAQSQIASTLADNLFNVKSTTQEVYDTMAKGVVTSAMEGIHGPRRQDPLLACAHSRFSRIC